MPIAPSEKQAIPTSKPIPGSEELASVQSVPISGMLSRRSENANCYFGGLRTALHPFVMDGDGRVFHPSTIGVRQRDRFATHLQSNGIGYKIHYPPAIQKQPLFKKHSGIVLRGAEKVRQEVISLSVHTTLSNEDVKYLLDVVNSYDG